ncbi:DUF6382 domain-containing protein [Cohnella sp. REN36]|uniref:DUF6382 domain-containing protein n=1 Tax=Cohnella sp. REN36 TaxID=2887347 RepID=UPI001D15AC6F|nr:DUF6382 domain-containing protein [Cohnella sp. REN36]MCC3375527.1 FHA domain-containing protein [Cohnella sp. REN36]
MNGYRVRFEQGRGHYMILEKEAPLRREEIDPVQLGMLKSCDLPRLLPLETEEMNGAVQFRYSLTGRRMLSQACRAVRWTMEDAMAALNALAEAMEQCQDCMLDADRLLLLDDYIFAGDGWHDLRFAYLPVAIANPDVPYADDLERLIVRWLMRVAELDGTAMQQLLRIASSPDFTPGLLKRYIRQYMADRLLRPDREVGTQRSTEAALRSDSRNRLQTDPEAGNARSVRSTPSREHMDGRSPPRRERDDSQQGNRLAGRSDPPDNPGGERKAAKESSRPGGKAFGWLPSPAGDPQTLSGLIGDGEAGEADKDEPSGSESGTPIGRWRTWLAVGGLAVSALAWRFLYADHPGQRGLLLAAGVTLGAAGVCAYLWNGTPATRRRKVASSPGLDHYRELDEDTGGSGTTPRSSEGGESGSDSRVAERFPKRGLRSWAELDQEVGREADVQPPLWSTDAGHSPAFAPTSSGSPLNEMPGLRSSLFGESTGETRHGAASAGWERGENSEMAGEFLTARLSSADEATALLSGHAGRPGALSYLEWESGDRKLNIALQGSSLIIGRSADAAQHVDETNGVSRAHLEMLRQADRWVAKDLGSRNGSWLNGQPMTPYEPYPLESGDQLQISSSIYRYRGQPASI